MTLFADMETYRGLQGLDRTDKPHVGSCVRTAI
jgi:hypothetical protein